MTKIEIFLFHISSEIIDLIESTFSLLYSRKIDYLLFAIRIHHFIVSNILIIGKSYMYKHVQWNKEIHLHNVDNYVIYVYDVLYNMLIHR